jgi:hypothetical protein
LLINLLPTTAIVIASGDVFAAALARPPPLGGKPLGNPAPRLAFAHLVRPIDNNWRHAFGNQPSSSRGAVATKQSSCCPISGLLQFTRNDDLTIRLLNPLSFVGAVRNGDAKPLDLFTAGGEAHLQFKPIVVGGIRFRPIERDQGWKLSRQALLDIGRFECRATHGDSAMFGRNGEADRGQRAGRAIGAHAGIDTDAHLAPGRCFDFAIKRRGLARRPRSA